MNVGEAITFLKRRMKNNTSSVLDDAILEEMNFVQRQELELGPFFPWFLETEMANTWVLVGDRRIPLPEDFICEREDSDLWLVQEDGRFCTLKKVAMDEGINRNLEKGQPKAYAIKGTYFLLFPTPDEDWQLKMTYNAHQPKLESVGDTNAWLQEASQWFLGRVGENLSLNFLGDPELAQRFQYMAETGKKALFVLDTERRVTNYAPQMGGG